MLNKETLDQINARISEVMADNPVRDAEKNLRALMTGLFSRLDLVTREEYNVQTQVLARAREKLSELEARVAELEKPVKRDT